MAYIHIPVPNGCLGPCLATLEVILLDRLKAIATASHTVETCRSGFWVMQRDGFQGCCPESHAYGLRIVVVDHPVYQQGLTQLHVLLEEPPGPVRHCS